MRKIILAILWVAGWIHVFGFAPEGGQSTLAFINEVMKTENRQVDPLVFMVFNLLGIWPFIMVAMLVQDEQGTLKAWPFAFSSMILGNSALYIYLFIRKPQSVFQGSVTSLIRFAESKLLAGVLLALTLALLIYGFTAGDFSVYQKAWKTHFFVNVMTVDFCLFTMAFALILSDDMRRREIPLNSSLWLCALIPVLGATLYLLLRPPLPK